MDKNAALKCLVDYLSSSREFLALKTTIEEVKKNPEISTLLNQFNQKQQTMYSGQYTQEQIQKMVEEINREYENLSRIPLVNAYFSQTEQFNQLFNQTMKEVNMYLENQLK